MGIGGFCLCMNVVMLSCFYWSESYTTMPPVPTAGRTTNSSPPRGCRTTAFPLFQSHLNVGGARARRQSDGALCYIIIIII